MGLTNCPRAACPRVKQLCRPADDAATGCAGAHLWRDGGCLGGVGSLGAGARPAQPGLEVAVIEDHCAVHSRAIAPDLLGSACKGGWDRHQCSWASACGSQVGRPGMRAGRTCQAQAAQAGHGAGQKTTKHRLRTCPASRPSSSSVTNPSSASVGSPRPQAGRNPATPAGA